MKLLINMPELTMAALNATQNQLPVWGVLTVLVLAIAVISAVAWTVVQNTPRGNAADESAFASGDAERQVGSLLRFFPGALVHVEKKDQWMIMVLGGQIGHSSECEGLTVSNRWVPLERVFIKNDADILSKIMDTSLRLDIPIEYECRIISGNSEEYWVCVTIASDPASHGTVGDGVIISANERRLLDKERESEKQLSDKMLDFAGAVMSVRDTNMKLVRTNQTFLDISGYSAEELYFAEGDHALLGNSWSAIKAIFEKVLKGGAPVISENPWYCKDGSVRHIRWRNSGLHDDDGRISHIVSIGVDLTDMRILQNQLRNSVDEFTALFENSMVGIAMIKNGRVVKANNTCSLLLDYTAEEMTDFDIQRLFDNNREYENFSEYVFPKSLCGVKHFDYQFKKKSGKRGDFRISVSPISDANLEEGYIIVLDDVSEIKIVERALKKSEKRFRTIFDRMAAGLALINEDGRFKEVNDSWCRITGYSREEAYGLSVIDVTYHEDVDFSVRAMQKFLTDVQEIERMEKRYIRKDGSVMWVDLTASRIDERAESGEMTLVSIINDITDRKQMEEALKEANVTLSTERDRVQLLAEHRMAVIEMFETFRNSNSIEDMLKILKNSLPRFVKYRDLVAGIRISRENPGYHLWDMLDECSHDNLLSLIDEGKGIIGRVALTKQMYLCNDVSKDPYFDNHNDSTRSYLALPILYKDFLWGVIGMDHFDVDHFNDHDVEIVTMVCTLIAMQMEEMTAKSALQDESVRLRKLHGLVKEMALVRSNTIIAQKIVNSDIFSEAHVYMAHQYEGFGKCSCPKCKERYASKEVFAAMASDMMLWEESNSDHPYNMALAIRYYDSRLGVLRLCSRNRFTEQEIDVAGILAEQTGVFIELNNLMARRELEAMIDPLTGAWNRRYIIDRINQEDSRISRYGGVACIAILDMGDFKKINDMYGHLAGDEVLVKAAEQIASSLRKTDYVGRFGGDEFIVFLPNTELKEAEMLFSRIEIAIKEIRISGVDRVIEVDTGVAMVPMDDASLMGAINIADERMYSRKRQRKRLASVNMDFTEA